jgi:ubiquinone biosynthesis accessory factor UbiK
MVAALYSLNNKFYLLPMQFFFLPRCTIAREIQENLMISILTQRLSQELKQTLPLLDSLIPKDQLHISLQAALARMELVTRSEFDAQSAVLQRTRLKLEALESRCAALEEIVRTNSHEH